MTRYSPLAILLSPLILSLSVTALTAAPLPSPEAEEPVLHQGLTEQTIKMGGPMPEEQMALSLEHVDLTIKIFTDEQRIEADAAITVLAKVGVESLILDFYPKYHVSEVTLDGARLDSSAYSNPEGQLRILLPVPLAAGERVKARIVYAGFPHVAKRPPWEGGLVWKETENGMPWVGSAVWGAGCDLLWPCIDHPTGKPDIVDLHYVVPSPLIAPGNGRFMGMTENDGWRTYNWQVRSPNTYGVTLNAAPFGVLEEQYHSRFGNSFPMMFWYLPEDEEKARALFEGFREILNFFESTFGPYPWADQKMGVVQSSYIGMEHQTLNSYGANYEQSPYGFDQLMEHEFAHEYFANQMSIANYDDMWLHEGFANYAQALYAEYLNGSMDYHAMLKTQRGDILNKQPLVAGRELTADEVYVSDTGPQGDIYNKGSLVLHTLRQLIGDDDFFDSARRLVYGRRDPKPGNFEPRFASTREFLLILNDVTGKDLSWFFNVYVYQAKLPVLNQGREGNTLTLTWKAPDDLPFPMPLEVRIGKKITTLPMRNGRGELVVPEGAHVTPDPDSKVLRQSDAIDRFQAWRDSQSVAAQE